MIFNIDTTTAVFGLISSIVIGLGSIYIWITRRKSSKLRDIAENRKEEKVSGVAGDEAIVNQLDFLMEKVAKMSNNTYSMQIQLNILSQENLAYKAAIGRLLILCDEHCPESDLCKGKIKAVLKTLKIDIHNTNDNPK